MLNKYDYSKVLGKMKEMGYTQESFANNLGISACSLNLSLNNKRDFKQDELIRACHLLHIPINDISDYFFKQKL